MYCHDLEQTQSARWLIPKSLTIRLVSKLSLDTFSIILFDVRNCCKISQHCTNWTRQLGVVEVAFFVTLLILVLANMARKINICPVNLQHYLLWGHKNCKYKILQHLLYNLCTGNAIYFLLIEVIFKVPMAYSLFCNYFQ